MTSTPPRRPPSRPSAGLDVRCFVGKTAWTKRSQPKPLVVEERLHDHHAVQQPGKLQHDHREGERFTARSGARVSARCCGRKTPLQPGGTDVLRRHHLGHGDPRHPGDVAHPVERDGENREKEVLEGRVYPSQPVAVPLNQRRPTTEEAKSVMKIHAGDVFRGGGAGDGEGRQRPVGCASLPRIPASTPRAGPWGAPSAASPPRT